MEVKKEKETVFDEITSVVSKLRSDRYSGIDWEEMAYCYLDAIINHCKRERKNIEKREANYDK